MENVKQESSRWKWLRRQTQERSAREQGPGIYRMPCAGGVSCEGDEGGSGEITEASECIVEKYERYSIADGKPQRVDF